MFVTGEIHCCCLNNVGFCKNIYLFNRKFCLFVSAPKKLDLLPHLGNTEPVQSDFVMMFL